MNSFNNVAELIIRKKNVDYERTRKRVSNALLTNIELTTVSKTKIINEGECVGSFFSISRRTLPR